MTFDEYAKYDALGLADLIRQKEVSPAEVVEAAIDRIEQENPRINAVVERQFNTARATAADRSWPCSEPVPHLLLVSPDRLLQIEFRN